MSSLSLGIFAQIRRADSGEGGVHSHDEFSYLVMGDGRQVLPTQDLKVCPFEPCLSLVLQIDPAIARRISADIWGHRSVAPPPVEAEELLAVSPLDEELMATLVRFLKSLSRVSDRRVLGPLYLQEIVFRVLQREQRARMLMIAAQHAEGNPVDAALTYIEARLAEPLTVETLAALTGLSASAFSRSFREMTGRSPYQFVKEARLQRGRDLMISGGRPVADVSRAVGYSSVSHFIKEFRGRFGTTPREYADALSSRKGLRSSALR